MYILGFNFYVINLFYVPFPDGIVRQTKYLPVERICYEMHHFRIIFYRQCGVKHYQNRTKRSRTFCSKLTFLKKSLTFPLYIFDLMCLQIKLESEITARKITNSRYAKMLHLKRMLDVVADIKERLRFLDL